MFFEAEIAPFLNFRSIFPLFSRPVGARSGVQNSGFSIRQEDGRSSIANRPTRDRVALSPIIPQTLAALTGADCGPTLEVVGCGGRNHGNKPG